MTKNEPTQSAIVEALLFVYGKEITCEKLSDLLEVSPDEAKRSAQMLKDKYDAQDDSGLRIVIHGDDIQMVTDPSVAKIIEQITKKEIEGPLTPVAMEVLAIIAYRGPISKIDIEAIRGVNCSFTLRNLLRRGLIERVSDDRSRAHQYRVTMDLLRILGVQSIEELPEFGELSTDKRIDAILYNEDHGDQSGK